jgi:hypothetical protein
LRGLTTPWYHGWMPVGDEAVQAEGGGGFEQPSWLAAYHGLSVEECRALARRERRIIRVITPHSGLTLELNRERVNIWLADEGQVTQVDTW